VLNGFFAFVMVVGSWYAMELVHEIGHFIGSCGNVRAISIPLLGFSSTEYEPGGDTLWAIGLGPILGAILPLALLAIPKRWAGGRVGWFFAAFCLVVNGVYLSAGSPLSAGDAADLLRMGVHPAFTVSVGSLFAIGGLIVLHYNGRWGGLVPDP
jgi:hypothetical protein